MKQLTQLILHKTVGDLQSEIHRSYAGMIWWILDPLLSLGVYYLVFGFLFANKEQSYVTFLFVGIIVWRWFQNSVQHSANSLIAHRPLMLLVNVRKIVFPISGTMADAFKFLLSLVVCLIVAGVVARGVHLTWLVLPAVIFVQLVFVLGCCLVAAAITPFVPDLYLLLPTFLQLTMFVSGVFYRVDVMPERVQLLIRLNPMTCIIEQYREVIMNGRLPNWGTLAVVAAIGMALAVVGGLMLQRFEKVYPKLA